MKSARKRGQTRRFSLFHASSLWNRHRHFKNWKHMFMNWWVFPEEVHKNRKTLLLTQHSIKMCSIIKSIDFLCVESRPATMFICRGRDILSSLVPIWMTLFEGMGFHIHRLSDWILYQDFIWVISLGFHPDSKVRTSSLQSITEGKLIALI